MALAPEDRRRYLRHLLLREVGESGQERLLAASFGVDAGEDPRAARVRADYLARAGLSSRSDASSGLPDGDAESARVTHVALGTPHEVARLSGRRSLEEAGAALLGALSAVETLKKVLGVGRALAPLDGLSLAQAEDSALP